MRRIVVGLVIVLVGAGFAGALASDSAIAVGGTTVSTSTLRAELNVIATHPNYACYLGPALGMPVTTTASQISAAVSAAWTTLQVKGIAVERYVEAHYNWRPASADLTAAETTYVSDLTNLAASDQASCAVSATAAVTGLPGWFRTSQLIQDAASEVFTEHAHGVVKLTTASLRAIYDANPHAYATICLSLVEVPDGARVQTFLNASQHSHLTVAELAKKYSIDASAKSGGAVGCFGPSVSGYSQIVGWTNQLALDRFPPTAQVDSGGNSYFLAATKRTLNSFAKVEPAILQAAQYANAQIAAQEQDAILFSASIAVNPEFGRWTPASATVRALLRPSRADTPNRGAGLGV